MPFYHGGMAYDKKRSLLTYPFQSLTPLIFTLSIVKEGGLFRKTRIL